MTYVFDLDRTLWDTFDRHHNPIWAKQMVPPYAASGDTIIDDVGSFCSIREGVRQYLAHLRGEGRDVGFVSVGAYFGLPNMLQPSVNLMNIFGISGFFNSIQILEYKKFNKARAFESLSGAIIYFDDNEKHLEEVRHLRNVTAINAADIKDWTKYVVQEFP